MGADRRLWVDDVTHMLHFRGQTFPCDRDIEAALSWREYALLLSSDTDCLSLWDIEGLVRLAKAGIYPQDMALHRDIAVVCGGADSMVHLLALPDLLPLASHLVPGMPERICIYDGAAYILILLTEPEVHTALLKMLLTNGEWVELQQFPGIPDAIAADHGGLWIALSEGASRLRWEEIST